MTYCKSCQQSLSWPAAEKKVKGQCEVCKDVFVECFELPDSQLHDPRAA
jgi:hypothetical protein